MAGYTVSALSTERTGPTTDFAVALCVCDMNGTGVGNLNEGDFAVRSITSETQFAIKKVHRAGLQGFYLVFLRAEPAATSGEHILGLAITHRHPVGRVPGDTYAGNTLLKVRVA